MKANEVSPVLLSSFNEQHRVPQKRTLIDRYAKRSQQFQQLGSHRESFSSAVGETTACTKAEVNSM